MTGGAHLAGAGLVELGRPRWRGEPERLEVWYATFTDPASGEGYWLHHEVVAPASGAAAYAHGWIAVFPPHAPPLVERFGPVDVGVADPGEGPWFEAADVMMGPATMRGSTEAVQWDLTYRDSAPALYTFPDYVWRRGLLPSAQVVPAPAMAVEGTIRVGGREVRLHGARGAMSRIYGRGNAHHWGWLHADLGDGDVLEIVAARGRAPLLRAVPPKVFCQLRVDGTDWPADPLLAVGATRARLALPRWYATVTGIHHRLRVGVRLPPISSVTLDYEDPDGAHANCTNSCRADAEVRLERREGTGWHLERRWSVRGTAHAEIGQRP